MGRARFANITTGFGMVELLVAIVFLSIVLLGVAGLNLHLAKQSVHASELTGLMAFARSLPTFIGDNPSWRRTVALNNSPSMACLRNQPWPNPPVPRLPCVPFQRNQFNLYDAAGNMIYNATNPANGVTINGIRCGPNAPPPFNVFSFSPFAANRNCPLRYNLEWAAMDSNPYPIVAIIVTLTMGQSGGAPVLNRVMNLNNYAFPYLLPSPPNFVLQGQWPTTLIYRSSI